MLPENPIFVALDTADLDQAMAWAQAVRPHVGGVKLGLEFFNGNGPDGVRRIVDLGLPVFLDLKFHDIPNTVAGAVRVAANMGVWMVNVHASGGLLMLEQARQALDSFGSDRPLLVGVTVLTSMAKPDLEQIGVQANPEEQVSKLTFLARDAGLDGVVCSASETRLLRAQLPDEFCLVTPGIRRAEDASRDQKRVVGPAEAIRNGSSYLVIGRPITRAESPENALQEFILAIASVS